MNPVWILIVVPLVCSGVEIGVPDEIANLPPEERAQALNQFCDQGCSLVPNEIIDQLDMKLEKNDREIEAQRNEIDHLYKLLDECRNGPR